MIIQLLILIRQVNDSFGDILLILVLIVIKLENTHTSYNSDMLLII